MSRFLLLALLVALLVIPATAEGKSSLRLRGTVALKDEANGLVALRTARLAVALRVPGSMSRIRIRQRVELRGSTLRARGHGSRILARNVSIANSRPLTGSSAPGADDDEVELKGTLTSLSPVSVVAGTRTVTCTVPAGVSLAGFASGDFVEVTCDLVAGSWVLRELKHEDDDVNEEENDEDENDEEDDDDNSGPGNGDDDDDNSGSGGGGGDD